MGKEALDEPQAMFPHSTNEPLLGSPEGEADMDMVLARKWMARHADAMSRFDGHFVV